MRRLLGILICILLLAACVSSGNTASKTGRITVPFTISKTGHILIKANINNKDVYLVVDTAAGASVIHKKQVDYLNLKASKSTGSVARGLGTSSYVMEKVYIPVMSIRKERYLNPFFIVLDLSHVEQASDKGFHGLLGSPFLQKYGAIIDYEQKIISLNFQNKSKVNKTNAPDKK